jgi:hypothetical protein
MSNFQNEPALGALAISTIYAGTGPCTLCSCTGYSDDGSGFSRCTCGDRKGDHRDEDVVNTQAEDDRLVIA